MKSLYPPGFLITALLIHFLLPLSISAETILLFTVDIGGDEDLIKSSIINSSAIEEGIMDDFFEAGHIIFNAGINENNPGNLPITADRLPVRLAKKSGASLLIEIDLKYPEGQRSTETLPIVVEYRFLNILSDENILTGTFSPENDSVDSDATPDRLCFLTGRMIAKELLKIL